LKSDCYVCTVIFRIDVSPLVLILTDFQTRDCFEAKSRRCVFCLFTVRFSLLPQLPPRLAGLILHLVQPRSSCFLCPVFHLVSVSGRNPSKGITGCLLKSLLFPSSVLEYGGLRVISRKLGLKYLTDASCEWL